MHITWESKLFALRGGSPSPGDFPNILIISFQGLDFSRFSTVHQTAAPEGEIL
jgi:hypothetical protein